MFDVTKMTDAELTAACARINEEMRLRNSKAQKEAWDAVVDALHAYIKKYGDIEFYENDCSHYINFHDYDFSSIGEIEVRY